MGKEEEIERAASAISAWSVGLRAGELWLLNNSGFGGYGPFPEPNLRHNLEMIDVNIRGAVHLTGLLLPEWKRRGGVIGNVASTAAFQPTAFLSVYGAGKAFLLHWSLAIREELREHNVRVTAICPGPTSTEFFRRAGSEEPVLDSWMGHDPEPVAEFILRAMRRGKPLAVPGVFNKTLTCLSSKLPKPVAGSIGARLLRRYRMGGRE